MAKLYRTSGTGNAQQTLDVNDEKIKIYANETSLDADLANIGENEIVATEEQNSPSYLAGMVMAFAGANAPQGWLLCDGSEVSRTTYSILFDVIGTTYGAGDGSSTFNLPDYRECALVGVGTNNTDTIPAHDIYTLGQFKNDQFQDHGHFTRNSSGTGGSGNTVPYGGSFTDENRGAIISITTITPGNDARHGGVTHGKQKGVNYIIKY